MHACHFLMEQKYDVTVNKNKQYEKALNILNGVNAKHIEDNAQI